MQYDLAALQASCPACCSGRAERLYRVGAAEAAQHYVLREVHPERHEALRQHIEHLWKGPTCDLARCTACGFGFAHPYVAGDAHFYALAYERTGYPTWKWEFEQTLGAIRGAALPAAFSVLEIGAGDGAFLKRLTPSLTPKDRVRATEFSDYGRETIRAYGVACDAVDVRSLPVDVPGAPFSVVCLFQVLEHLDNLDGLFEHIAALTTPDAHLFAAVPNDARIEFNEHHGSLLDMPPNHVGRWTRAAFEAIAGRHGWRVEAHETEPEGALSKAKELVTYRYMRRRQNPGSLANRVERVRSVDVRRVLRVGVAAAYGVFAVPTAVRMAASPSLGGSQWVHLRTSRGTLTP